MTGWEIGKAECKMDWIQGGVKQVCIHPFQSKQLIEMWFDVTMPLQAGGKFRLYSKRPRVTVLRSSKAGMFNSVKDFVCKL